MGLPTLGDAETSDGCTLILAMVLKEAWGYYQAQKRRRQSNGRLAVRIQVASRG